MEGFLYFICMDKFNIICELYTKFNDITFEEGPHEYYDSDGNRKKYMSGSRFASQFLREPFEKIADEKAEKKANELGMTKQEVLDMWKHNNEFACNMGTDVHMAAELSWQHKLYDIDPSVEHFKTFREMREKFYKFYNFAKDVLIPIKNELVVYDKELKVCGTIDFLCYRPIDDSFIIVDWKGLPLDTKIPTPEGWSTMGELNVGDYVYDKNGKKTKVIHKSEIHNNPCYRITFKDGYSIVADYEHKWEISFYNVYKKCYTNKVMTTLEIMEYLKSIENNKYSYNLPRILTSKPIECDEAELPIDPYVLGCWLGDGSKTCGILTNVRPEMWEEIVKRGYTLSENLSKDNVHAEMRTIYGLRTHLNSLNLINNKHIPDIYQRSSYNQRLDLLRGIMDTDGYYNKARKRYEMETTQKWQYEDLIKLLSSLGVKCSLSEVTKNYKNTKAYRVSFSTLDFSPFLIRNTDVKICENNYNEFRIIKSVEPCETVKTQCIEVDSDTHTFLCTERFIVTHNTNKNLTRNSFKKYDKVLKQWKPTMMLEPFDDLEECHLSEYSMQLSLYKLILERNTSIKISELILVHMDPNLEYPEIIPCIDLSDRILEVLKKQNNIT